MRKPTIRTSATRIGIRATKASKDMDTVSSLCPERGGCGKKQFSNFSLTEYAFRLEQKETTRNLSPEKNHETNLCDFSDMFYRK
jgi:hypothetical protein